ncbi:curlin [Oricola thermophila]|uniref:Curlin n=1 Tax=Oricola thermophila TaxID=2742145 RepID=A0A6N1VD72_9HYPH|nr:curlin [Oricola thermophila]QKV18463.1 curlin [Oricola thermophila]
MPRRKLIASLFAAAAAVSAVTAPAMAGGSISVSIAPQGPEAEQAMRAGLGIYSVVNGLQNGGNITQLGMNNLAGIAQNGSGNHGIVHQEGDGHSGTLQQNGNGNAYGLFQFGKGTDAHVVQNGNGQTGATFAWGW